MEHIVIQHIEETHESRLVESNFEDFQTNDDLN